MSLVQIALVIAILALLFVIIMAAGQQAEINALKALSGNDGGISQVTSTANTLKTNIQGFLDDDTITCTVIKGSLDELKAAIENAKVQGGIKGDGPKWLSEQAIEHLQEKIDDLCE